MKKCFTLIEIIAVIAIVGILITAGTVGFNRSWQNSKIDSCEADMREIAAGLQSYILDYGNIVLEADEKYQDGISDVVGILNKNYLSYDFEIEDIADDKKSVSLVSKIKEDSWNNKYRLKIYTEKDGEVTEGLAVVISNGPDCKSNIEKYEDENYGDDIIAIIEPR